MTIFNWVRKKLHQDVIKDGVTKNEKKRSEGTSEIEKNTKAIMDQVGLVDALDIWFDGVLTIGTFGFDNLKFQEEKGEYERDDDECESVDLEYVVIDGSIIKNVNQELDPLISIDNKFFDHHDDLGVLVNVDHLDSVKTAGIRPVIAAAAEAKMDPRKRSTTLAELFVEDQDEGDGTWHDKKKPKNPNLDVDGHHQEVKFYNQKGSKLTSKFSFGKKKVISKSKDKEKDLSQVKKVHQMIKRMMNKKIHPDIEATKAIKKEVPYKPTHKSDEALESLCLLHTEDCVA